MFDKVLNTALYVQRKHQTRTLKLEDRRTKTIFVFSYIQPHPFHYQDYETLWQKRLCDLIFQFQDFSLQFIKLI